MKFWPEKKWKKILLIVLLVFVIVVASVLGFVLFKINSDYVSGIDVLNADTPSVLVPAIINQIREALNDESHLSDEWLSSIEKGALEILRAPSFVSDEFPEITAAAVVYESARRHHGKKLIQLPHRLLGHMCGWGEAKVARATKDLFDRK